MTTNFSTNYSKTSEPANYYEVLQVSPKADPEIIEAAYRRLALKFHPDHNASPEATGQMQTLNEAYNILKDPQRRQEYDRQLNTPFYTDDLTEDDYIPPTRSARWKATFKTGRQVVTGWTGFGWLLVVLLLSMLLVFWLIQNTESQASNNTPISEAISPRPTVTLPEGTRFFDDFESVAGANWLLDSPWHLTSRYSSSGKFSLWFGDESRGRYSPNLSAAATMVKPVQLDKTTKPALHFWLSGQSDHDQVPTGEDRLFVEIAPAGQDFQTIFTANGLYPSWQEISLDLSRWKGQAIVCRFRFTSGTLNSGAGFSGFFIDDVKITDF